MFVDDFLENDVHLFIELFDCLFIYLFLRISDRMDNKAELT